MPFRKRLLITGALAAALHLQAADHKDSPASQEANLDITDLYAFTRGDSMVFVMNVSPLLTPGSATANAAFNPEGLYQFKLDKERDGVEEAVIQVTFEGSGTSQTVSVRGPGAPGVKGTGGNVLLDATPVTGAFDQVLRGAGVTAFAGPRDDPFFLHLMGDSSLTSVLNAAYAGALGAAVGSPAEQSLAFSRSGPDDFAGTNVLSIVVMVPKAALMAALGMPAPGPIHVWATTSAKD